MKQFILFMNMVLFACTVLAQDPAYPAPPPAPQNIVKAEYFIDTDPGFGNGTDIPITAAVDINNLPVTVNTTGLSNGIHRLWIRTRNNEGAWAVTAAREFVVNFDPAYTPVVVPQNIVQAEYYIDTDPGFGNGTAITITPAVDINGLVAAINTTGLSNGIHRVYVRTRNNEGRWGITNQRDFIVDNDPSYPVAPTAQNLIQAEYYIDTDPGIGNRTAITITPAVDINNLVAGINTTGLSNGIHRLYIRSRNNEGRWSITNNKDFIVDNDPVYPSAPAAPQNIVQAEYFINTDPGIGNGTAISITSAVDINNLVASINTSALATGSTNRLYVRSRNNEGNWSITNIATFVVDIVSDPVYPSAPAAPQNIVQAEYFMNTAPGIGNGIPIAITPALDINNLLIAVNTSALAAGSTNRLYVRSKNNEGNWSITNIATFVVDIVNDPAYPAAPPAPGNITYAEYFFDTDPGFGNGTPIAITPGVDINNLVVSTNVAALSLGNHRLFVRSLDDWSITSVQTFLKASALPLNFLSFSAVGNRNDVLLNWDTDNEINTSHFDVEWSKDGIVFETIAQVKANNTGGTHQYSYTHRSPSGILLFYRIKQVDPDGRYEYSSTAKVNMQQSTKGILYPNPAADIIYLRNINADDVQEVSIIGADGKTLLQFSAISNMQLNISSLKAGMYVLKLVKKDQTKQQIQFVKQ